MLLPEDKVRCGKNAVKKETLRQISDWYSDNGLGKDSTSTS